VSLYLLKKGRKGQKRAENGALSTAPPNPCAWPLLTFNAKLVELHFPQAVSHLSQYPFSLMPTLPLQSDPFWLLDPLPQNKLL
jgi:hypothetical protein